MYNNTCWTILVFDKIIPKEKDTVEHQLCNNTGQCNVPLGKNNCKNQVIHT